MGDMVLVKTHEHSVNARGSNAGFAPKRHGSFLVIKQLGSEVYIVQVEERFIKIDGTQMLSFYLAGRTSDNQ